MGYYFRKGLVGMGIGGKEGGQQDKDWIGSRNSDYQFKLDAVQRSCEH